MISKSQIIISQKLNCAICHKPLLEFNKLSNLSKIGQEIYNFDTILDNKTLESKISTNSFLKYQGQAWYQGIQIDHMISKILMKGNDEFKLLNANVFKAALHINYHKLKTRIGQ